MAEIATERSKPNILITGTPGTGKSIICAKLASILDYKWIDVSKLSVEQNFIEEFDNEYDCPILDEDKILDYLEPTMKLGGNIVEYHGCEFFPERWFDVVFVVRCDNTLLYDRLEKRNYNAKKLQSNIECEIFQTILDEAKEAYEPDIVHEIRSETESDLEENLKNISNWVKQWIKDNTD